MAIATIRSLHFMILYFFYDDLAAFHLFSHLIVLFHLIIFDLVDFFGIFQAISHFNFLSLDLIFNLVIFLHPPLIFPLFMNKFVL